MSMEMFKNQKHVALPMDRRGALKLVRLGWFVALLISAVLYLLSISPQFASLQMTCSGADCQYGQLTAAGMTQLHSLGLAPDAYIAYDIALNTLLVLAFAGVAAIIFWRKSNDWMGLYVAYTLLLFGLSFSNPLTLVAHSYSALRVPLEILSIGASSLFGVFLFIFPDGQFVPRWTRWLAPFIVLREASNVLFPSSLLPAVALVVMLILVLFAQVYRYRRVSNDVQRQQTKWFLFGLTITILGFGSMTLVGAVTGFESNLDVASFLVLSTAFYAFVIMIPFSIGMAILRSRLWDIDIFIRRTIIYGLLTGLLALFYFGSVTLLQHLLSAVTGQRSDVAIIISTLAIAALFVPVRNRVQQLIDHRFYRRKYNAARILSTFSVVVRDEVDLHHLTDELESVVDETMQPEHISVWLKPAAGGQPKGGN